MKALPLLPSRFKKIGWLIFIPSLIFGLYVLLTGFEPGWLNGKVFSIFPTEISAQKKYFSFVHANLTNTIVGILFLVGALLISFTREKNEDEFISRIRLDSLLWAVLVNYLLLLLAFILVYDIAFLTVMVYNMFTILLLFIARFHYLLNKNSKFVSDDK